MKPTSHCWCAMWSDPFRGSDNHVRQVTDPAPVIGIGRGGGAGAGLGGGAGVGPGAGGGVGADGWASGGDWGAGGAHAVSSPASIKIDGFIIIRPLSCVARLLPIGRAC